MKIKSLGQWSNLIKFRKLLLAWLAANITLMLYSVASAQAATWCDDQLFEDIKSVKLEKMVACLEAGADPNAKGKNGRTPLHYVAMHESPAEVVKLLLDAGANPNARDEMGETPLHPAAWEGSVEAVKLLLEAGADPNSRMDFGWSPLSKAMWKGSVEVVKLLLEAGADPNAREANGHPPLHYVVVRESPVEMVKLLLEVGADPNAKDEMGETPLHLAAWKGSAEAAKLLLDAGADPNAKVDHYGWTPLIKAIWKKQSSVEVVKLLLEAGADPRTRDAAGHAPLDYTGSTEVRRLLLAVGARVVDTGTGE